MTPQQAIEVIESKRLYLVGTRSLVYKKLTVTQKVTFFRDKNGKRKVLTREFLDTHYEVLDTFPLSEVPKESIKSLRKTGIPGFILKAAGKYYYTSVPRNINFIAQKLIKSGHKCSQSCTHLSPIPMELGGCLKIYDDQMHIEDLDFIQAGYESFNCKSSYNALFVASCTHYEKAEPRKKLSAAQKKKINKDFIDFFQWYLEESSKRTTQSFL